ncbi:hypothetical protein CC1G_06500 [Coprinopsis cinerea okayama7|uniref:Uncharacterized protein n=1 Tax=Coprinopsis cinerea (strain Okayama-7 / 130 / ATCC MYA-4618 / FGSC 9003) TaxID=240176 RepID=A8NNC2_COPC7|nr:hypothetical protein CC1G_06500 [Coprinopsis cinerea okayama7\|eukprot:XP_001835097.1 hypothetical protein CC1G_06500 [Coprinopsis cinerea okayama7\
MSSTTRLTLPPLPHWDDKTKRPANFERDKLPNLTFDYIRAKAPGQGIGLTALLHGDDAHWLAPLMVDGTMPVVSPVMSYITLYVSWPGYEDIMDDDMTDIPLFSLGDSGDPLDMTSLTRAEFARAVGGVVAMFILNRKIRCLKGTDPEWDLDGIELGDVVVSGIRHVFGQVYQADIHIEKGT